MRRFEVILECHIVRLSEAQKIKTLQTYNFFGEDDNKKGDIL